MTGKISDPDYEPISPKEMELAERLRSLCTIVGEEKEECLVESGKAFVEMGELYLVKAQETDGMLQKLCFIRSCALLNGAKSRFKQKHDSQKLCETDELLRKFTVTLFKTIGVERPSLYLNEVSDHISKDLSYIRREMATKLENVSQIDAKFKGDSPYDSDVPAEEVQIIEEMYLLMKDGVVQSSVDSIYGCGLYPREVQKIDQMSRIMRECTITFTSFMVKISDWCHEVLGPAPCRYALLGLGSLPRGEVTLFSDFEHVIALDDNIKGSDDCAKIIEYFRWYAVVFQIIIIGLGETFIRSVGVKSINNLYSKIKSENWYFDCFTPCGIAFDGMVPHSCNNPLGRQETSQLKKSKVELIQTSSDMAKFLTSSEHLKNGYYLADILVRTCLVHGDVEVYNKFLEESKKILDSEYYIVTRKQVEEIKNNANPFVPEQVVFRPTSHIDYKKALYRPVTALLAYLARISGITTSSSFGIISELRMKNLITEGTSHFLNYAVAVACEIRMKAYCMTGHQRHGLAVEDVINLVGERSAVDCYLHLGILRRLAIGQVLYWKEGMAPIFVGELNLLYMKAFTLFTFGHFTQAFHWARRGLENGELNRNLYGSLEDCNHYSFCLVQGYCLTELGKLVDSNAKIRIKFFESAAQKFNEYREMKNCPTHLASNCYYNECSALMKLGRFKEIEKLLEEWREMLKSSKDMMNVKDHSDKILEIQIQINTLSNKLEDNSIFKEQSDTDLCSGIYLMVEDMKLFTAKNQKTKTKSVASLILNRINENPNEAKKNAQTVFKFLTHVCKVQFSNEWYEDVLKTIQLSRSISSSDSNIFGDFDVDNVEIKALFNMDKFSDCIIKINSLKTKVARDKFEYMLLFCQAELESELLKKIPLLQKAWIVCSKTDKYCYVVWSRTMGCLLYCSQAAIQATKLFNSVCYLYSQTPDDVKKATKSLNFRTCALLLKIMIVVEKYAENDNFKNVRQYLTTSLNVFHDSLLHPLYFILFQNLARFPNIKNDKEVVGMLGDLKNSFVKKYSEIGTKKRMTHYNRAVVHFSDLNLQDSAKKLWYVINTTFTKNNTLYRISAELLLVICMKANTLDDDIPQLSENFINFRRAKL